jgi:hypothetical protein
LRCLPLKEGHLWHANMPNISIAFMISQFGCAVHVKVYWMRKFRRLECLRSEFLR